MKKNEIAVRVETSGVVANCDQFIAQRIYSIRGMQVMLDRDLADLYGVETKRLNEQVRRNSERFPDGFMFKLTDAEFAEWKSQIATSNSFKNRGKPTTTEIAKFNRQYKNLSDGHATADRRSPVGRTRQGEYRRPAWRCRSSVSQSGGNAPGVDACVRILEVP